MTWRSTVPAIASAIMVASLAVVGGSEPASAAKAGLNQLLAVDHELGSTRLLRLDPKSLRMLAESPRLTGGSFGQAYAFSPDGRSVAFAMYRGESTPARVQIVDLETLRPSRPFSVGTRSVLRLAWPEPKRLLAIESRGALIRVDLPSRTWKRQLPPQYERDFQDVEATKRGLVLLTIPDSAGAATLVHMSLATGVRTLTLHGLRQSHVTLEVDSDRERAFVLAPHAQYAEIDLRTMTVEHRPLDHALGAFTANQVAPGLLRISRYDAFGGPFRSVEVLDTRTRRLLTLDPRIQGVGNSHNLLIGSGGISSISTAIGPDGLIMYNREGREAFRLFRGRVALLVGTFDRYVYARVLGAVGSTSFGQGPIQVVDLRTRRVIRRVKVTSSLSFLPRTLGYA